jgi:hypothetical protein
VASLSSLLKPAAQVHLFFFHLCLLFLCLFDSFRVFINSNVCPAFAAFANMKPSLKI